MIRLPRHAELWLPGVARTALRRDAVPLRHVWLLLTDHYEPYWRGAAPATAAARVARWSDRWPRIAARHVDSHGRPPCYTFFYPEEEYDAALLDALGALRDAGIADVEVHLHHDGEGEADFRQRIAGFVTRLRQRHGLLREREGRPAWCFIHGNWALDNSHPEGRYCGLDNELTILQELGCVADFTLPAAPSPCQTRIVNSIYRAIDDPARPRSHDYGTPVRPGQPSNGGLLMVQGPLTLRRHQQRRWWPGVECGELTRVDPPSRHRVDRWLAVAPRIAGHAFVKLHTHGAQEDTAAALLDGGLDRLFSLLAEACEARQLTLGFVSAWRAVELIESLEAGRNPVETLA
jgi:hypothetical protein